ncbi:type II toxin-antitoxin system RelE/ParE family toxin [uncultured Legionella sp.]|uniref:type II toxin-antitoxin system RelE/ParE family toxin n=1 Tax=uncultured Legionella sp. TaxID=210934 RepID=UPI002616E39D|nr:type II toxin-antitoxin system RelE/ParE family toxin [uncultured Legionella sp.]
MSEIQIRQMPAFKKAYKKLANTHKLVVNEVIHAIVKDPSIGEEKKGDLSGVYVYKFKINHQQMLLAYEWDYENRILMALGVHENFYRDLKRK